MTRDKPSKSLILSVKKGVKHISQFNSEYTHCSVSISNLVKLSPTPQPKDLSQPANCQKYVPPSLCRSDHKNGIEKHHVLGHILSCELKFSCNCLTLVF